MTTDFELTKSVAEELGLGYLRPAEDEHSPGSAVEYNADPANEAWMIFDPLNDDMQAMELIKGRRLSCQFFDEDGWRGWLVGTKPWQEGHWAKDEDLNRAIVLCLATIRARPVSSSQGSEG